jgi:hypothetical protein
MRVKVRIGTALVLPIAVLLAGGCSRDGDGPGDPPPTAATAPGQAATVDPSAAPADPPADPSDGPGAPAGNPPAPGRGAITATAPGGPPGRESLPLNDLRPSWVVGTITRGGSGPCYGLKGEDGVDYAVYSATSHKLNKGQRIRTKLIPGSTPKSCGTGRPVTMGGLQIAG